MSEPPKLAASSLVLLKAEDSGSPVFMANGLGGTVSGLAELVCHMQVTRPIYGLEPRGIDGLEEPLDRIEDMAEYHLSAIRQMQPRGPYFLIGYSLGGLVNLEIAQRLSKNGEKVALLAMLDSYPDRHYLSFGQHASLILRLARMRAGSILRIASHQNLSGNGDGGDPFDESTRRTLQRVKAYQYRAWRSYNPTFYDGKVNFVQARIRSLFPDNPIAIWSPLLKGFEMETLACDHQAMLTTHAANLASIVSRYVEQAQ